MFFPSARERYPDGPLLFLQDNCAVHKSMDVQRWLSERPEIVEIALPVSPDLNVIESAWARLKERTRELIADRLPRNHDELSDHVLDAWEEIAQDLNYFRRLADSMPRRAEGVREAEGYWKKILVVQ